VGKKVESPPHGTLYERRFTDVQARPTLRDLLNTAREEGFLVDYRFANDGLTVRRRWLEGPTLDGMFQRIPADDRIRFSAEAFAKLLRQLDSLRAAGLEHGAIHPGNVIIARGVQLIDVVSNASRLGASTEDSRFYPVWMWGPTAPDGRGWGRWDRVSLLRMCAMLALGPDSWHDWWSADEMIVACERWVADARKLFVADAEAAVRMETSLALARRLVDEGELPVAPPGEERASDEDPAGEEGAPEGAVPIQVVPVQEIPDDLIPVDIESMDEDEGVTDAYPVPEEATEAHAAAPPRALGPAHGEALVPPDATSLPEPEPEPEPAPTPSPDPEEDPEAALREDPIRWFGDHMDSFRTHSNETILRPEQEARAIRAAVNDGLSPDRARSALAEWLDGSGLAREETLRTQASRTVMEGKHFGKWVRVRSILMAEWLFTNRGMEAEEARHIVRQIIGEQGLSDEREFRKEWAPALERYLHKNCPRLAYKPRQYKKMIELVAERGVPPKLAERWVKKFLSELGYELKEGWFG